jgi:hypothetical protein
MLDAIVGWTFGAGLPFAILLMACIVVVFEAVRSSRQALWGDMFADDADD